MFGQKTYPAFLLFLLVLSITVTAQDRPINQPTPVTVIGDFHRQDNIRYATGYNFLDWYGSGDVNNDEKIDDEDLNSILGSTSYRADVDGDGTPGTGNDKVTLEDYLNGVKPYLPGHWDKLQTPEERVSWLEKMIPIEKEIREGQNYTGLDVMQSFINFNGVSDISGYIEWESNFSGIYDSTANSLFNIPVRTLGLRNEGGPFDMSRLLVLHEDNPLDVTNYYFFDPKTGEEFSLDEVLDYDYVSVGSSYKYKSILGDEGFTYNPNLVSFVIENNGQKEIDYMEGYVLRNSPRLSSVSLTAPNDVVIDKTAYESNPDLLSDDYGSFGIDSSPPEGDDFYWEDAAQNYVRGRVENELEKSIVDTTYLNPDSTMFKVKVKGKANQLEKDIWGNYMTGGLSNYVYNLSSDSAYYNITVDLTTGVESESPLEKKFEVYQNYPNPFNPTTTIKFTIPVVETTRRVVFTNLTVYDALGREVKKLINKPLAPGSHELQFDGSELPSGIYFYRLTSGTHTQTRKMMLLK